MTITCKNKPPSPPSAFLHILFKIKCPTPFPTTHTQFKHNSTPVKNVLSYLILCWSLLLAEEEQRADSAAGWWREENVKESERERGWCRWRKMGERQREKEREEGGACACVLNGALHKSVWTMGSHWELMSEMNILNYIWQAVYYCWFVEALINHKSNTVTVI